MLCSMSQTFLCSIHPYLRRSLCRYRCRCCWCWQRRGCFTEQVSSEGLLQECAVWRKLRAEVPILLIGCGSSLINQRVFGVPLTKFDSWRVRVFVSFLIGQLKRLGLSFRLQPLRRLLVQLFIIQQLFWPLQRLLRVRVLLLGVQRWLWCIRNLGIFHRKCSRIDIRICRSYGRSPHSCVPSTCIVSTFWLRQI